MTVGLVRDAPLLTEPINSRMVNSEVLPRNGVRGDRAAGDGHKLHTSSTGLGTARQQHPSFLRGKSVYQQLCDANTKYPRVPPEPALHKC